MALPADFLDELRARTPLAGLIGRRTRLARSGRNWKGCCPFHGEKTPSFYVYDDHFHCFGCGAHGDAISFVMQSERADFIEAVQRLASEAGLEVPRPTEAAVAAERQRKDLRGVLSAAAEVFSRWLGTDAGRDARDYLRRRGVSDASVERFGLGWSGAGRGAVAGELARVGITPEQLIEAGLMRPGEDGRPAGDMFFGRLMFPIRDARGLVIGFGGRTLGDGQPKYLNGPETALFSKRRTLFGLDLARAGMAAGGRGVVVEGYLDVIALHQAGFAGAVAPLGTALTEQQLEEVWKLSAEPLLCFDGDGAGSRAALRAIETALPLLTPERTLRIARLPAGDDPDSLVRRGGAGAFEAVAVAALPLSEALFEFQRGAVGMTSPEQRAALRRRLEAAAATIRDQSLASEYRRVLLDRYFQFVRQRPVGRGPVDRGGARSAGWRGDGVRFPRPLADPVATRGARLSKLLALLLHYPQLMRVVDEALMRLELPAPMTRVRTALVAWSDAAESLDSDGLLHHVRQLGYAEEIDRILSDSQVAPLPTGSPPQSVEEAEAAWWHFFALIDPDGLEQEVVHARRAFEQRMDAGAQRRLTALCMARELLRRGEYGPERDESHAVS